jgi:hypothetical protein
MSTIIEEATEGLREARNSLGRAEEELREWKAANQPLNTLHPTYHCFHIFFRVKLCVTSKSQKNISPISPKKW